MSDRVGVQGEICRRRASRNRGSWRFGEEALGLSDRGELRRELHRHRVLKNKGSGEARGM